MAETTIMNHWPKELQNMVLLKAALWANGDTDELMQQAIQSYQKDIPLADECCFECNTETKEVLADYEIPDGKHVVFEGVPTMICPNCGHKEWDLNVIAALERISEEITGNTRIKLTDVLMA